MGGEGDFDAESRSRGGAEGESKAESAEAAEISGLRSEADGALEGWRERHDEESTSCGWVSGEKKEESELRSD